MRISTYKKMMKFGRKLFKQEQKKYNGHLRFAYLKDDETGETLYFIPNGFDADRVKKCLAAEFIEI